MEPSANVIDLINIVDFIDFIVFIDFIKNSFEAGQARQNVSIQS